MNLSKKQIKLFRRVHKKYKVSLEFLTANFNKVIHLYKYATSFHVIIKKKFRLRKNRAFILYNCLRKNIFQTKQRKTSIKSLSWSKRITMCRKKLRAIQKIHNETVENEIIENEKIKDKIVEDEQIVDKIFEDENIYDNIFENIDSDEDDFLKDIIFEDDDIDDDKIADGILNDKNVEDEVAEERNDDPALSPEEVQQKLKEQLNILKGGKRSISLLGSGNSERSKPSSTSASAESSQRNSPNHLKENLILNNILIRKSDLVEDISIGNITQENTTIDKETEEENITTDEISPTRKSGNFLDSLISKLKCNDNLPGSSVSGESDTIPCRRISIGRVSLPPPPPPLPLPILLTPPTPSGKQASDEETSSNSSDFHGFTELDVDRGRVPGMLPTPIVNKILAGAQHSAFVSEELENFMKENALDNCTNVEIPKRKVIEEGLVCDGAPIPKMFMPAISEEHARPRTVAEKRSILLQKQNNMKYWMLDDEHTIYRELQRRSKPLYKPNLSIAKHVQNSAAPATRDCWKASSWLSTEKGKFFLQMANIDGIEYKIIGTRGNNYSKILPKQNSMASLKKVKSKNCPPHCQRLIEDFKRIKIINPIKTEVDFKKKLLTAPDLKIPICSVQTDFVPKPSPLSKKCMINQSNNLNLGPLEIYDMPKIELEVFPKLDKPLDDFVKPYLKLIMPSDNISREWAEFAVSTLVTNKNKKRIRRSSIARESFKFEIPFINNEDRLLVRKIFKRQEKFEKYNNYEDLEFSKNVDTSDTNEVACADMITDMINSIALGLSENSIIKKDPDINYTNVVKTNAMTVEEDNQTKNIKQTIAKKEKHGKQKLLSELKRLNATVIDANNFYEKDIKECKELHCRLGCVCQSLAGRSIVKKHCRKLSCMFECGCKQNPSIETENMNKIISNADALLLREQATAKLAKVEKDFCSTVVLSDNKTFLINESQTERKRPKKVPKRYDDYSVLGDDSPKKSSVPINNHIQNNTLNKENVEKQKPLYIFSNEKTIDTFKHCSVALNKIRGLESVQPWCMIHCLYKCFCENKSTSGIPFKIQKVDDIVADTVIYARKPAYSFAKENDKSPIKKINENHKFFGTNNYKNEDSNKDKKSERCFTPKTKYLKSCFENGCRSTIIPVHYYRQVNKERFQKIFNKSIPKENIKHQKILERKIRKSLFVQSDEQGKLKKISNMTIAESDDICMRSIQNSTPSIASETDSTVSNFDIPKMPIIASVCSLNTSSMITSPIIAPPITTTAPMISPQTITSPIVSSPMTTRPVSLLSDIIDDDRSERNTNLRGLITNNITCEPKLTSKNFHNKSIAKLNMAVTKTMNSIRSIQKKNTKHIPSPVPKTLSSHQWQYFLEAYLEGLIFVWEIKLRTASIVAVTKTNIMPLVPSALSVANIKAVRTETLPLIAKMLNAKIMNDKLKLLSILMTGHNGYWRIIGFINSTKNYLEHGCFARPTPETHPRLSEKVNQLFKMLMIRELKVLSDFRNKRGTLLKSINNYRMPSVMTTGTTASTSTIVNNAEKPSTSFKGFSGIPKAQLPPSNICIQKVPTNEIESIYIPIPIVGNHRWLMLSLADDFSHIYVPTWKNFLSCDKIKKAITIAIRTKKTVRLGQGISDLDVYATSEYKNRIYIGPFPFDRQLDIILYQNVDGRMMLREDFERSQNIHRIAKTVGCWLYMKNDQLILRDDESSTNSNSNSVKNQNNGDDDCQIIIIEESGKKDDTDVRLNSFSNIIPSKEHPKELDITATLSLSDELLVSTAQSVDPFNESVLNGNQRNNIIKPTEFRPVPLLEGRTLANSEHSIFTAPEKPSAPSTKKNQKKDSKNPAPVRAKPILKRRMTEYYPAPQNNKSAKNPLQYRLSNLEMNSLNLSMPIQNVNDMALKQLLNIKSIPPLTPMTNTSMKIQQNSIQEINGPYRILLPASPPITSTNQNLILPNNLPKSLSITKELVVQPSVESSKPPVTDVSISLQTEEKKSSINKPTNYAPKLYQKNTTNLSSPAVSVPSLHEEKIPKVLPHEIDPLLEPEASIKSFTILKKKPIPLDTPSPSNTSNSKQIPITTNAIPSVPKISEPFKSAPPSTVTLTSSTKDKNVISLSDAKEIIRNRNLMILNSAADKLVLKKIIKRPNLVPITTSVPAKVIVTDVAQQLGKNTVPRTTTATSIDTTTIPAKVVVTPSIKKSTVARTINTSSIGGGSSMPGKHLVTDVTQLNRKNSVQRNVTASPVEKSELPSKSTSLLGKVFSIDKVPVPAKIAVPRTTNTSPMTTTLTGKNSVPRTITSSKPATVATASTTSSSSSTTVTGTNVFKTNRTSTGSSSISSPSSSPLKIVEAVSLAVPNTNDSEKNQSEYGFLISNVMALGKIPTKKLETGFLIKIPDYNSPIKVAGIEKANEMLQNYLRVRIKEFIPKDLNLCWRFIKSADPIANRYKLHNAQILNSEMIITGQSILQRRFPNTVKSSTSTISSKEASPIQLCLMETIKKAKKTYTVVKKPENQLKTNSPNQIAAHNNVSNKQPKINHLKETDPLAGDAQMRKLATPPSQLNASEVILIDDDDD